MPPSRKPLPTSPTTYFREALPVNVSTTSMKKGLKPQHWGDEEDHNQLDDMWSLPAVTTPEGPFLDVNQADPNSRLIL